MRLYYALRYGKPDTSSIWICARRVVATVKSAEHHRQLTRGNTNDGVDNTDLHERLPFPNRDRDNTFPFRVFDRVV
ncbi:MAG: hypothetical protein AAF497_29290, partial [Planctomycetota bacterium]